MSKTLSNLVKKYRRAKIGNKFQFPHVRKVSPTLISQQVVSVQPMSLPSGLLFYLDYSYTSGSNKQE